MSLLSCMYMIADAIGGVNGVMKGAGVPNKSGTAIFNLVLNMVYFVTGFLAIGMIIYAGIQYVTANGEAEKAKKAMNTIIFSVVGLIIILIAFAITSFVISRAGA